MATVEATGAMWVLGFGISAPDLLVIGIVVLLIFGPDKVPELGRSLGRAMRDFRKIADEFTGATASIRAEVSQATDTLRSEFTGVYSSTGSSAQRPVEPAAPPIEVSTDKPREALKISSGIAAHSDGRDTPAPAVQGDAQGTKPLALTSLPPTVAEKGEQP